MRKIALIGMSGSGKTFWSNRLAKCGYRLISCDDRIEQKLAPEVSAAGQRGIGGVARWMGWPDSATYREREQKYLRCEIAVMREILCELARARQDKIVVDSTGSVVYTGKELCRELRDSATIVYLEASPQERAILIERYLEDPKPVLWGEHFQPRKGETAREAVARCYPQLIEHRRGMYEELAHRVVRISDLRGVPLTGNDFLRILEEQVRPAR